MPKNLTKNLSRISNLQKINSKEFSFLKFLLTKESPKGSPLNQMKILQNPKISTRYFDYIVSWIMKKNNLHRLSAHPGTAQSLCTAQSNSFFQHMLGKWRTRHFENKLYRQFIGDLFGESSCAGIYSFLKTF